MYEIKDLNKLCDAVEKINGGCGHCIFEFLNAIEPELADLIASNIRLYGEKPVKVDGKWSLND